jgi:CDP-ribitol ribitolphosphotransferase
VTIAVEILECRWERIQLHLRVRRADGGPPLQDLALRRDTGGELAAPVHLEVGDGETFARFNVMQGPHALPLDPGRWEVLAPVGGASPATVVPASGTQGPAEVAARFQLGRGEYRVEVVIGDVGNLALDVVLDPSIRRPGPPMTPMRFVERHVRRVLRPVRRAVFRLIFLVARATRPRGRPVILFTSDSNDHLSGNLKLVHDRMLERHVDREFEMRTMLRARARHGRGIRHRMRLPAALARADVVVLDDYHPLVYILEFGPNVKVVQLWHASGAFKTVGYSRVGRPGAPSPFGRAHKNYTHAIVSSRFEIPCYAEAFGIPESRVFATGVPRMDRFFDEPTRAANRDATHAMFPATQGRFTILFAPTFRGNGARGAHYDLELLDYHALHALCVEKNAVVLFRMHPFVRTPLLIPAALRDRLLDASAPGIDVNDLLPAVDLVVTDYSSVVFEFAALGKPMLFFAYDLEEYVSSRGFYTPYEEFVPGRIVRSFADLLAAIRSDDYEAEKVAAFAARHLDHVDGRSVDRVVDLIVAPGA